MSSTASLYFELCKPRVVALIVFTAVVGMFLSVPGWPPASALIAGTLGIPEGTVMSRLFHARRRLRETLAPMLDEDIVNSDGASAKDKREARR